MSRYVDIEPYRARLQAIIDQFNNDEYISDDNFVLKTLKLVAKQLDEIPTTKGDVEEET